MKEIDGVVMDKPFRGGLHQHGGLAVWYVAVISWMERQRYFVGKWRWDKRGDKAM